MKIFGREFSLFGKKAMRVPDGRWQVVHDFFTGAWQQDAKLDKEEVTAYWAVFSCATTIASDFSKCPPVVMRKNGKIWEKTLIRRPLLKRPNGFQTGIEFFFCWAMSKLLNGNTYVLKQRDRQGFVEAMFVLDPMKVIPLVSDDGRVFYELSSDNLAQIPEGKVVVPASEIIHDKMYPLFHPLVGISPLYACGGAAAQGIAIQKNSQKFFQNMSRPGGILTAPKGISDENASKLKASFEERYSGENAGRLLVIGADLSYQSLAINPEDAQLVEQLKMTAEMVAACFKVPGYKIGVGQMPTVNNTATLNQQYYDQCLQYVFETTEAVLDYGLELPREHELWFDTSNLLRMDPEARYKSYNEAIKGSWMAPNEAREREDMKPVEGGSSPMAQQQNYSLAALAKRDAKEDPFGKSDPAPTDDDEAEVMEMAMDLMSHKHALTVRKAEWTS